MQKHNIEEDVFASSANDPSIQIWGQMLLSLKNSGDNLLYAMCDGVIKTEINNNEFCLYVSSRSSYDELGDVRVFAKLKEEIAKITNLTAKLVFEEKIDEEIAKINYLKEKFGEKLVVNNQN